MIVVENQEVKNAISGNGRRFSMKVKSKSGQYYDITKATINFPFSPTRLTYGSVSSSDISFEMKDCPFIKNEVVTIYLYVLVKGEIISDSAFQMGEYRITEIKMSNKKANISKLTAHDRLNFVSGKYKPSLKGEQKVSAIFKDICNQVVTETKNLGFINDNAVAEYSDRLNDSKLKVSLLSGYELREALRFISAYIGCSVVMNRKCQIEMRPFKSASYDLLNPNRISTPTLSETDTKIQFLIAKISNDDKVYASSVTTPQDGIIYTNPIATQSSMLQVLNNESVLSKYRICQIKQILGDPRLEQGDSISLTGVEDDPINVPIMHLSFNFDGGLSAQIKSFEPEDNEKLTVAEKIEFSIKSNETTSNYVDSVLDFSTTINGALGLYKTEVTDSEGGTIIYLHNKSSLSESTYIATWTSSGFAMTDNWNNGNPIWRTGIDYKGTAVYNIIKANKITADMINTTDLVVDNAYLADFTVKSPIIYSAGTLETDNSLKSYGVGITKPLNNIFLTFYSGYTPNVLSNLTEEEQEKYNSKAEYPERYEKYKGTPFEFYGVQKSEDIFNRINFYVRSDGKVVSKNAEFPNDTRTRITKISGGEISIGADVTSNGVTSYSKYGIMIPESNPFWTSSFSSDKYLRTYSDTLGVMISSNYNINSADYDDPKSWQHAKFYILYNEPQTILGDEVSHYFNGNVFIDGGHLRARNAIIDNVTGNLAIEGIVNSQGGNYQARGQYIMGYSVGYNVVIGNANQGYEDLSTGAVTGGYTNIYARTGLDVRFGNRAYFSLGAKLQSNQYISIGNSSNDYAAFGYGKVQISSTSSLTGVHTGISDFNHYLWGTVLFPSGSAVVSDRDFKTDIESFSEKYESLFCALKPRTFKYKDGTSGRTHFGFIAQELEEAIEEVGLTTQDVSAYIEAKNEEGETEVKSIRYTDIISLNTHMIQKCLSKIDSLESEIKKLKGESSNG